MVNFKDLEEEIKKSPRNFFTYYNGLYLIHSQPLKCSLRGLLSNWKGGCEVNYDVEKNVMEHRLESDGIFGIYREMTDLSDELVVFGESRKGFINEAASVPPVEKVIVPPVPPVVVGSDLADIKSRGEGNYTSFTFRKDIKTGRKTLEKITRKGNREDIVIEEENPIVYEEPQGSRFMEIDENEIKEEQQVPPHRPYKK